MAEVRETIDATNYQSRRRQYGSHTNYVERIALDQADRPAVQEYKMHANKMQSESAILDAMVLPPPSFIDPLRLTTLPLHLLGVPDGSEAYTKVKLHKADLRSTRKPLMEGERPPDTPWHDYTDSGWPTAHGLAQRVGTPEEHQEIERRLKSGGLTMPGSEVGLKRQTLAEAVAENLPEPGWIIEGLLRHGGAMMVYGPTGVGKSWFVHTLMLMASHGRSVGVQDAETGTWVLRAGAHDALKVGLIDGEMIKADLTKRDVLLCEALGFIPSSAGAAGEPLDTQQLRIVMEKDGAEPQDVEAACALYDERARLAATENATTLPGASPVIIDLHNVEMHLKTDQDARAVFPDLADPKWKVRLVDYAVNEGLDVLVFDNLSTLCPSLKDENQAAEWMPLNDLIVALKHAGIASIVVHHAGKGGNYRGSSNMVTTLETVVNLKTTERAADDIGDARFLVAVEKSRSHGVPKIDGKILRLAIGGWVVEADETGDIERLLKALKTHQYTSQKELGVAINRAQGQVSKLYTAAVMQGIMSREEWTGHLAQAKEFRKNPPVLVDDEPVEDLEL